MNQKSVILEDDFYLAIVDQAPYAIIACCPKRKIRYVNEAARQFLQLPGDEFIGQPVEKYVVGMTSPADTLPDHPLVLSLPFKPSIRLLADCRARPLRYGVEPWTVYYLNDAAARRQREMSLELEALTDHLSGLLNRRGFQRVLERATDQCLTLSIIDIDHFKSLNDSHGHPIGDAAIERMGEILKSTFVNRAICVARLGGDEFGVLMKTAKSPETDRALLNEFTEAIRNATLGETGTFA